jgi:DNA modification methylase
MNEYRVIKEINMKTIEELKNKVIQGDCLEVMKDIPS